MTHEHRANDESDAGPENDVRLPDARMVPVFLAPTDSDAAPLLADLDD